MLFIHSLNLLLLSSKQPPINSPIGIISPYTTFSQDCFSEYGYPYFIHSSDNIFISGDIHIEDMQLQGGSDLYFGGYSTDFSLTSSTRKAPILVKVTSHNVVTYAISIQGFSDKKVTALSVNDGNGYVLMAINTGPVVFLIVDSVGTSIKKFTIKVDGINFQDPISAGNIQYKTMDLDSTSQDIVFITGTTQGVLFMAAIYDNGPTVAQFFSTHASNANNLVTRILIPSSVGAAYTAGNIIMDGGDQVSYISRFVVPSAGNSIFYDQDYLLRTTSFLYDKVIQIEASSKHMIASCSQDQASNDAGLIFYIFNSDFSDSDFYQYRITPTGYSVLGCLAFEALSDLTTYYAVFQIVAQNDQYVLFRSENDQMTTSSSLIYNGFPQTFTVLGFQYVSSTETYFLGYGHGTTNNGPLFAYDTIMIWQIDGTAGGCIMNSQTTSSATISDLGRPYSYGAFIFASSSRITYQPGTNMITGTTPISMTSSPCTQQAILYTVVQDPAISSASYCTGDGAVDIQVPFDYNTCDEVYGFSSIKILEDTSGDSFLQSVDIYGKSLVIEVETSNVNDVAAYSYTVQATDIVGSVSGTGNLVLNIYDSSIDCNCAYLTCDLTFTDEIVYTQTGSVNTLQLFQADVSIPACSVIHEIGFTPSLNIISSSMYLQDVNGVQYLFWNFETDYNTYTTESFNLDLNLHTIGTTSDCAYLLTFTVENGCFETEPTFTFSPNTDQLYFDFADGDQQDIWELISHSLEPLCSFLDDFTLTAVTVDNGDGTESATSKFSVSGNIISADLTSPTDIGTHNLLLKYRLRYSVNGLQYTRSAVPFTVYVTDECFTATADKGTYPKYEYEIGATDADEIVISVTDFELEPTLVTCPDFDQYSVQIRTVNQVFGDGTDLPSAWTSADLAYYDSSNKQIHLKASDLSQVGRYIFTVVGEVTSTSKLDYIDFEVEYFDGCWYTSFSRADPQLSTYSYFLRYTQSSILIPSAVQNTSQVICGVVSYGYEVMNPLLNSPYFSWAEPYFRVAGVDKLVDANGRELSEYEFQLSMYNSISVYSGKRKPEDPELYFSVKIVDPCFRAKVFESEIISQSSYYYLGQAPLTLAFSEFTHEDSQSFATCGSISYSMSFFYNEEFGQESFAFSPSTRSIEIYSSDARSVSAYKFEIVGTLDEYPRVSSSLEVTFPICDVEVPEIEDVEFTLGDPVKVVLVPLFIRNADVGCPYVSNSISVLNGGDGTLDPEVFTLLHESNSDAIAIFTESYDKVGLYQIQVESYWAGSTYLAQFQIKVQCYVSRLYSQQVEEDQEAVLGEELVVRVGQFFQIPNCLREVAYTAFLRGGTQLPNFVEFNALEMDFVVQASSIDHLGSYQIGLSGYMTNPNSAVILAAPSYFTLNVYYEIDRETGTPVVAPPSSNSSNFTALSTSGSLQFSVLSFSRSGLVQLTFQPNVKARDDFEYFDEWAVFRVTLWQADPQFQEIEVEWRVLAFDSALILMQVDFEEPLLADLYELKITVLDNTKFQEKFGDQYIEEGFSTAKQVPAQFKYPSTPYMSHPNLDSSLPKFSSSLQTLLAALLGASIVASMALYLPQTLDEFSDLTTQILWGLINAVQLIVHIPLMNIRTPANLFTLYSFVIEVTQFDVLPSEEIFEEVFNFTDTLPFNDNFDYTDIF